MSGFRITGGKGFQVTFDNGWTVSVQFGPYNYCDNRELPASASARATLALTAREADVECETAEIAAWDANGEWYSFEHDTVDGWKSPADVLVFMQMVAAK